MPMLKNGNLQTLEALKMASFPKLNLTISDPEEDWLRVQSGRLTISVTSDDFYNSIIS